MYEVIYCFLEALQSPGGREDTSRVRRGECKEGKTGGYFTFRDTSGFWREMAACPLPYDAT